MAIGTSDGQRYESRIDLLTGQNEGFGPIIGDKKADLSYQQSDIPIDREHHVPLIATAKMGPNGEMVGLGIDHRIQVPPEYIPHLAKHEAAELPHMQNLIDAGMKPMDAYHEAHDKIATPIETASVRAEATRKGLDPDQYHEQYKQFFRDALKVTSQPSDRDIGADHHTTVYGLNPEMKMAEVIDFPQAHAREPLRINVLGEGTAMHSGPAPFKRPEKYQEGKKPSNDNKKEGDLAAMERFMQEKPEAYKYWRSYFEQKGGEDWKNWQANERLSRKLGGPINPAPEAKDPRLPRNRLQVIEGDKE